MYELPPRFNTWWVLLRRGRGFYCGFMAGVVRKSMHSQACRGLKLYADLHAHDACPHMHNLIWVAGPTRIVLQAGPLPARTRVYEPCTIWSCVPAQAQP